MAGSLENRGKLRELIDKFKFVEDLSKAENRIFDKNIQAAIKY